MEGDPQFFLRIQVITEVFLIRLTDFPMKVDASMSTLYATSGYVHELFENV